MNEIPERNEWELLLLQTPQKPGKIDWPNIRVHYYILHAKE